MNRSAPTPATHNAYTDSPDLHPRLLAAAVQVVIWLVFHPSAWRNCLARIGPDIAPAFTILGLSEEQRRHPDLRRLLWCGHVVWPLIVIVSLSAITLILTGGSVPRALLAVTACALAMSCLSVIAGLAVGMIAGAAAIGAGVLLIALYAALPVDHLLLRTAVVGVAFGQAGNMAAGLVDQKRRGPVLREVGGALIGILFAVVAVALAVVVAILLMPVERAAGSAIPWPASLWIGLAASAPLALAAGASCWRNRSIRAAGAGAGLSLAFGGLLGLAFTRAEVMPLSLAYGAALGAFLTALFALPYLAAQRFTSSPAAAIAGMTGACGLFAVLGVAEPL